MVNVDLGLLLHASEEIKNHYHEEKAFLISLAAMFHGSRAAVITYSNDAVQRIHLDDYSEINAFKHAVDVLPLMGNGTRIDKALRLAQSQMFSEDSGARHRVPKVLFVLTYGSQILSERAESPGIVAEELRASGISLIVVGIGSHINENDLIRIAGWKEDAYKVESFDDLLSEEFLKSVGGNACRSMLI